MFAPETAAVGLAGEEASLLGILSCCADWDCWT
jgi:hypothetical protein